MGSYLALLALVAAVVFAVLWLRGQSVVRTLRATLEATRSRLTAQAEEQERLLEQAMVRREALFDSMGDGVLLLDAGGDIQLVNRAFCRLFHLPSDVQGRPVEEAVRLPALQAVIRKARENGSVPAIELALEGVGHRTLEVNATRIQRAGSECEGLLLVCHDLTRLKQLENTRKEFVANVSHELRTPLSIIKGYVETILDGAATRPEEVTRFLRIVLKHTNLLATLSDDLLTISSIESGETKLDLRPVSLRRLTGLVLDDLRPRAERRQVTLVNEVPPGLTARADAGRIQQVVLNLVDNAVKYGRPEGHVWVGGKSVDERLVEVWVRDDGPGIPPDALTRIYERFYRVDKARSRDQGGTGLGLAIVKHLVQSHGGEVRTESHPGQGARFHFTLPAAANEGADQSASSQ
ncbi:MAG: PAS domain-containing protein [Verrucomicrobiales bacterium]|nr:PAS domain-containing protein [Verrucomicrobiales bacterium]MCP5526274.1 PAS domain-containing protein [Verrucomicrobiales bacterium]